MDTHYTTVEQSKKLVDAGMDSATADIHYNNVYGEEHIPCWSTGQLLELLPRKVSDGKRTLSAGVYFDHGNRITYYDDSRHRVEFQVSGDRFINLLYDTFIWLLNNKYYPAKTNL